MSPEHSKVHYSGENVIRQTPLIAVIINFTVVGSSVPAICTMLTKVRIKISERFEATRKNNLYSTWNHSRTTCIMLRYMIVDMYLHVGTWCVHEEE